MSKLIRDSINSALEIYGKIYVHAFLHNGLSLGKRGLVGDEKEKGIVLAISSLSCKNLNIGEDGLFAELKFSGVWESVFVPYKAISAIFDSISDPEFIFSFRKNYTDSLIENEDKEKQATKTTDTSSKIIKPDFTKNKKD